MPSPTNTILVHDNGAGEGKLALEQMIGVHSRCRWWRLVWGLVLWDPVELLAVHGFLPSLAMCKGCTLTS
jgi:hypothetical protein